MTGWDLERSVLRGILSAKRRSLKALGQESRTTPVGEWARAPVRGREVILAGDSIVRRMPPDVLSELTEGPTVNHGWGGDTIAQLADRLRITTGRYPSALILQVGTNDMLRGASVDAAAADFFHIAHLARDQLVDGTLVICSLPPIARWRCDPRAVRQLNASLREITCKVEGGFADVFQALAASDGTPRPGVAADGVHLTRKAYRDYQSVLRRTLEQSAQ